MLIQILRWLMRPKVLRLTCFASSAFGLISYALSSSFNHLYGKWTWWKLSLYAVFSFIICLAVLFSKAWQFSTTLKLKAQLAFLVLAITSIYSFFWDKTVKGKPDAYSLTSCAAFAIMSLGLSKQTHCGFEIDLLYFFCGCLITQLMKIKLWLGALGMSFSYFLVILRSVLDHPPLLVDSSSVHVQDNHVVIQVNSDSHDVGSTTQLDSVSSQAGTSPAGFSHLTVPQQANSDIESPPENGDTGDYVVTPINSSSQQANSDNGLIKLQFMACIKALKKENSKLISIVSKHVDEFLEGENLFISGGQEYFASSRVRLPLQPDVNLVMDSLPSRLINHLQESVKLMIAAGFEDECCRAYSSFRREFLRKCLSGFGIHDLNLDNKVEKTQNWIKASTVALRLLFPNERRLCDRIFEGFSSAVYVSFMQVCRNLTIRILKFANDVATGNLRPNDFLHVISKVSETMNGLLPEFESLFSDQYSVSLTNEALKVWEGLREAHGGIFLKLENLICHDMMHEDVPYGGVHPITSEVVKCIRHVINYMKIVGNQVFTEYSTIFDKEGNSRSIKDQLEQILDLLENKLEAKSKSYRNPALGCIFMINNLRYIAGSYIIRFSFFKKGLEKKINYSGILYHTSSWNKVLEILKLDNNESEEPNVVAELMKDKLNLFNMHFDEICRVQSKWHVFDNRVKEAIVKSIENILLPIYGEFIGRFQNVLGNRAYEHIKYGMFDIQDRLNHLFVVITPVSLQLIEKTTEF